MEVDSNELKYYDKPSRPGHNVKPRKVIPISRITGLQLLTLANQKKYVLRILTSDRNLILQFAGKR